MRVLFALGTCPEAIKLAPVIKTFKSSPVFTTQVVLTGQHREMVAQVMDIFGLIADRDLVIMQHKQTLNRGEIHIEEVCLAELFKQAVFEWWHRVAMSGMVLDVNTQ
jgi:UDP-N-acetylglucosamine 2-epimerase